MYYLLRCGAPLWGSFLCAISSTIEKYKIAGKAQSLMFNLANTSDPDRHVAETRQGRARWQNDDGQAEHELVLTATLVPRRQDVTSIVTLHAVAAIQDMTIT